MFSQSVVEKHISGLIYKKSRRARSLAFRCRRSWPSLRLGEVIFRN